MYQNVCKTWHKLKYEKIRWLLFTHWAFAAINVQDTIKLKHRHEKF